MYDAPCLRKVHEISTSCFTQCNKKNYILEEKHIR